MDLRIRNVTERINERLGFEQLGHLNEIAVVQGQKRGLVIWALRIPHRIADPEVIREAAE